MEAGWVVESVGTARPTPSGLVAGSFTLYSKYSGIHRMHTGSLQRESA